MRRKIKKTIDYIKSNLVEFLKWEIRKMAVDVKFFVITSSTTITVTYVIEREEEVDKPEACERCQKKTDDLSHFQKFEIDEFVCNNCYVAYLLDSEN